MADGQRNNGAKIVAIIQARMQSSRLPGKVLMPLPFPKGKPVLKQIVDNLRSIEAIDGIYIASSENQQNMPLENFCVSENIHFHRGSEQNVLGRFIHLIDEKNPSHIIRLTGDNPIQDKECLRKVLREHLANNNDYTNSIGLPLGMNIEIVRAVSLIEASNDPAILPEDIEHVTTYLKRNNQFKKQTVEFPNDLSSVRLTIDYPADYAMISLLLLEAGGPITSLNQLRSILNKKQWIAEINQDMIQRSVFNNFNEEIKFAYNLLERYDLKRSSEVLKKGYEK